MKRGESGQYALTEEEVTRLWAACREVEDKVLIGLLLFCGLRVSEAVHLNASWIKAGEIYIPHQMDCLCWDCRDRGYWKPKTATGSRILPIPKTLETHLLIYLNSKPEGLNITRVSAWRKVKQIAKSAKLTSKVFPHSLRATCATLLANNLEAAPLAYALGWSNISIASHYVNISRARKKAAEGIRQTFG